MPKDFDPTSDAQRHVAIWLGLFQLSWCAYEAILDCLLGELMSLPDIPAHYVTAGMQHSTKVKLVRTLLKRSKRTDANAIRELIASINTTSKRNILIHAYVMMNKDENTITFVSRRMESDYQYKEYPFTLPGWVNHSGTFVQAVSDLQELCGYSGDRIDEFCKAASKGES